MSSEDVEDVQISGDMIRLGQLLKYVGIAESGADAARIIGDGDVRVDGESEERRGRQLEAGALVEVDLPEGVRRLRIT